jgi:hypothetical protein
MPSLETTNRHADFRGLPPNLEGVLMTYSIIRQGKHTFIEQIK